MRYKRVKDVAWRRIDGVTVIVSLGRRRMLAVNEAGGAVWDAVAEGATVPPGEAARFLADLEAEGVVERLATDEGGTGVTVLAGQPPTVVWREELQNFGGGCAFHSGESDICNQTPQSS